MWTHVARLLASHLLQHECVQVAAGSPSTTIVFWRAACLKGMLRVPGSHLVLDVLYDIYATFVLVFHVLYLFLDNSYNIHETDVSIFDVLYLFIDKLYVTSIFFIDTFHVLYLVSTFCMIFMSFS